jgi:threonine synthase
MNSYNSNDDHFFNLKDGASGGATRELLSSLEEYKNIVVNKTNPIQERLETFEYIIDSEVGDTSFIRARNIERQTGIRQLYMKFEGGNPTGTQKDRIAFAHVHDALRLGYDVICAATCGNYGAALSVACSLSGLKCVIHIPKRYHSKRIKDMEDVGVSVNYVDSDYEGTLDYSKIFAKEHGFYDANPGGANTDIQLKAYGGIANEIYDDLKDAPKYVALPVSNGTTLAGVYKGFLSLYRRGKTSRMPSIIAGSSHRKNPIIRAFLENSEKCFDLKPDEIKETEINEPLINWHSIDGELSLKFIRESNGSASNASDKSMMNAAKFVKEREGLSVLPASTAGLIALVNHHKINPLLNDRYVVILTGRK